MGLQPTSPSDFARGNCMETTGLQLPRPLWLTSQRATSVPTTERAGSSGTIRRQWAARKSRRQAVSSPVWSIRAMPVGLATHHIGATVRPPDESRRGDGCRYCRRCLWRRKSGQEARTFWWRGFEPMAIAGAVRSRAVPLFASQRAASSRPALLDRDRRPCLGCSLSGAARRHQEGLTIRWIEVDAAATRQHRKDLLVNVPLPTACQP